MQERRPLAYGHSADQEYHHNNNWQLPTPPQPLSAPPELGHDRTSGAYFGYDAARDSQDIGTQNVPSSGLETQHLLERIQPHLAQAEQHLMTASSEVHPYLRGQQTQVRQESMAQQGPLTAPSRNFPPGTRLSMRGSGDTGASNEQARLQPGASGSGPARTRGVLQRSNVVMHTHM